MRKHCFNRGSNTLEPTIQHRINASHLQLALKARKTLRLCRWAAMSNGSHTNSCTTRAGHYALPHPPLLMPMTRGDMDSVIERTRLHFGLPEVRRTFGTHYTAMLAETAGATL